MSDYIHPSVLDFDDDIIETKLEFLVSTTPEIVRRQLDRCLKSTFIGAFDAFAVSGEGKGFVANYFTEDPKVVDFHVLAYSIICPTMIYGGALGKLVLSVNRVDELRDKIFVKASKVFKFSQESKPIPSSNRSDLVKFARWRETQRRIRGNELGN